MATDRAHGTQKRYDRGPDEHGREGVGCRCVRCKAAKRLRTKQNRLNRLRGKSAYVGAEPVRRHVASLRAHAELPAIARAAGVKAKVLDHLMYGRPSDGFPPSRSIRRETADALLAVRPSDLAPAQVCVVGTQRRLRALAVAGWPVRPIAEACGIHEDIAARIMRAAPGSKVTTRTAERVKAGCASLWMRDPLQAGVSLAVVNRLRRVSTAKGWVPLLAWDDIDDPTAEPQGVRAVGA